MLRHDEIRRSGYRRIVFPSLAGLNIGLNIKPDAELKAKRNALTWIFYDTRWDIPLPPMFDWYDAAACINFLVVLGIVK